LVAFHELGDVACHELFVFGAALAGGGSEGDWSTVHVHFAVADFVEPGPGESGSASREGGRDSEGVDIRIYLSGASIVIARYAFSRATALDGVDDFPYAVLGWGRVVRNGELTGASTMHRASHEGYGLF
jgi:hypothetical protein